jgi:4-hydroxybenzoate polyprenyltransferase
MTSSVLGASPPSRRRGAALAFAQLLRIPNVFTAIADIAMGALVVAAWPGAWATLPFLLVASSCLYCAGMVWNDYFDLEQDRRERPFRPLPSGRVAPATAPFLAAVLIGVGLACAACADWLNERFPGPSLLLAGALVAAILLYDGWLKRTVLGPVAMGSCRFLNVLLGLTVAPAAGPPPWGFFLALVVGVYIVGVTWFARTEARTSNQRVLRYAALVILAALVLALAVPAVGQPLPRGDYDSHQYLQVGLGQVLFPYLLVAFGFYLAVPLSRAITRPEPANVQAAVKRCVLGLILFDALLACSLAGTIGLSLVLLLIPARLLGRWVYST